MKICRTCKEPDKEYYKEEYAQCIDCLVKLSTKQRIKKKFLADNAIEMFALMDNISKCKEPVVMFCLIKDIKKFVKRANTYIENEYKKKVGV